jgi:DNA polymerase
MITIDFETRSVADLIKWGQYRYAMDVSTQALCLAWQFEEDPIDGPVHLWHRGHPWIEKSPRPDELIERIRDGEPVEAHNAGFEFHIWNEALRREFPEFDVMIKPEQLFCSAAKASCLSLPRSLDGAVEALKLPYKKIADGKRLIQKLSKPMPKSKKRPGIHFCEEEVEHRKNWVYCQGDVRAERGLSEYCPEMPARERDYWLMDFRMNLRGVSLDIDAAKRGLEVAGVEAERLNAEIYELTGGAVEGFTKRKQLLPWLNGKLREIADFAPEDHELLTPLPNTKADTFSFRIFGLPTKAADEAKKVNKTKMDAKWEELGDDGAIVHRVLEIAMEGNRSSTAKYKRMLQCVTPDERVHDIMLFNGADRTGRWSGKGIQPHNFVRGYSKTMGEVWDDLLHQDRDFIEIVHEQPMVALAKACRGALVASPGKDLYAADFNAIEARKLAWLSGCSRLLKLFQENGDPYVDMACAIYKLPLPTTKDELKLFKKIHANERQLGKKAILGLGYAMGWEKFQASVFQDEGIWLDDALCRSIVNIYRKEMYPEIPGLWKAAEHAAIKAVTESGEHYCGGDEVGIGAVSYFMDRDFLHCRLPSGRLLAYLHPEVHTRVNYRFQGAQRARQPNAGNLSSKEAHQSTPCAPACRRACEKAGQDSAQRKSRQLRHAAPFIHGARYLYEVVEALRHARRHTRGEFRPSKLA